MKMSYFMQNKPNGSEENCALVRFSVMLNLEAQFFPRCITLT